MISTTAAAGPAAGPIAPPASSGTARLVGLDVARGLAVLGMFAAHSTVPLPGNVLYELVSGRSAILFAVLAGVSIALLSGGARPGSERLSAPVRIAVRAVVLFVLGLALTTMQVPAMVILTSYGVLFLLSIPLLRLRTTALAVLAAVFAVGAPLASFALRSALPTPNVIGYTPRFADFTSLDGLAKVAESVLLNGAYPVLTWIPFLLVGMALGRLDLRAVRGRLVLVGTALGLVGYGGSWLVMHVFGGYERIAAVYAGIMPPELLPMVLSSSYGTVPTMDPVLLLTAGAHSGTPFEIIGGTGVALAIIGLCLLAERLRVVLAPVASVGAMALTAYVGHLLALKAVGPDNLGRMMVEQPYAPWLILCVATMVLTLVWRLLLGRGPLEWLLHHLSALPARRRPA
ncbi:DUF418 domain-containing protein [Saccharopolyspora cebuensis]|uniref:Heparan-alpha-glucosaminide N-acetyltransferase domain-containing protein n=1 Tax=Saccharopolyspora cebuensis TaxID=418759 RepID=A0ABV4CHP2_9PSEU